MMTMLHTLHHTCRNRRRSVETQEVLSVHWKCTQKREVNLHAEPPQVKHTAAQDKIKQAARPHQKMERIEMIERYGYVRSLVEK